MSGHMDQTGAIWCIVVPMSLAFLINDAVQLELEVALAGQACRTEHGGFLYLTWRVGHQIGSEAASLLPICA